ncbi:MAG: DSF synthase [Gammaproteobacteria bacterium]|jgi:DSF synthase
MSKHRIEAKKIIKVPDAKASRHRYKLIINAGSRLTRRRVYSMSTVVAQERDFVTLARPRILPPSTIPNTELLDLSYDSTRRALWIHLPTRAPSFVSLALMRDLLRVDAVASTSLIATLRAAPPRIDFRVIASKRPGIFSLGGDLQTFRELIGKSDRDALRCYAQTALDAIWTNIRNGSQYRDNITSISLVEGEAQGGGFEAALSSHVLIAEKGAMFGFPEALFGMFPGMGGYALLTARTNADCARRLIGSTNRYSAEMLYEMGVVDILAETGKGKETVNDWIGNSTQESTAGYRARFDNLNRAELSASVDDWVEQALTLSERQLRTMGYILSAQRTASESPPKSKITHLRRAISFPDICSEPLFQTTQDGIPAPLMLSPKSGKRFDENDFVTFVKSASPWIYDNLTRHGALLLRGFSNSGSASLDRLSAALRADRTFNASQLIPTPTGLFENVFEDDCCPHNTPQELHNAFADCSVYPAVKILSCFGSNEQSDVFVTIANTHAIYQQLDRSIVSEFENRGVSYQRIFPNIPDSSIRGASHLERIHSWQNIFKTELRAEVERKCRENCLSVAWRRDGTVEVRNIAPACISHSGTGERLWFNHVHLIHASSRFLPKPQSLLSKIFSRRDPQAIFQARFGDGTAIPESYIGEVMASHRKCTMEVSLKAGDFLVIDNALSAQGRYALGEDQSLLMTTF